MTKTIEFYFDFSSPYGYFASHKIDELAEKFDREAVWKPIMLGPVFERSGNQPLGDQPLKGAYSRHDWERMGRYMEVPWVLPEPFPIATLSAARAFYWLDDEDSELARRFARVVFDAYFGRGIDISPAGMVADLGESLGIDSNALLNAVADPAIKDRLKAETARAIDLGVCGSPFFVVDGEPFWGSDRLWMIKKWLERGGW